MAGAAFLAVPVEAVAQVGLEVQAYPAGVIAVGRLDVGSVVSLHAGGNFTDRRDFGRHENEQGQGFGAGVGFRLPAQSRGWQFGTRLDFWSLEIDWMTQAGNALISGSSQVQVLQPTVRAGYTVSPGETVLLTFGAALGWELNVRTSGEEVGEGAIMLLGVAFLFRR